MGADPYILRQELEAGNNFDRDDIPSDNPERAGLIQTWPGRSSGGVFHFNAIADGSLFYQLVRVVLEFEDASDFEIGIRHRPQDDDRLLGTASTGGYETKLVDWSGSFNSTSALVTAETFDGTRVIVDDIDYMLTSEEQVWVETSGASKSLWAEVAGLPIPSNTEDSVGLPFDRR